MLDPFKKVWKPAAWLVYLIIVFEIVYMISPFALYYYSTYGPSLNFLHNWPLTAWLSGFFLPHFAVTASGILNVLPKIGWSCIFTGLSLFLIAAGQIYYAKFTKRGAVAGGLYKAIRHPQYVAFAIMGLGLLLAWPRFTVLVMYVTMLFVYFLLAKKEEQECVKKYGDSYTVYQARTSMFIPGRIFEKLPALPLTGFKRGTVIFLLYLTVLMAAVSAAFGLRNYTITKLSTYYSTDSATIAVAAMESAELEETLQIALANSDVQNRLQAAMQGTHETYLNYLVPLDWYLPDLPLENIPAGIAGHHQPEDFNRDRYKILFTKARLRTDQPVSGADIIKNTVARVPAVVVKVDKSKSEVIGIETPPPHVRWGDIPTPLF